MIRFFFGRLRHFFALFPAIPSPPVLGGGGVGKTHTLSRVIEPMAITYFGEGGYLAKAQSNYAAHNLGSRGRTIHSANGILMSDSLQTARLRLNPQTQKKLARLLNTAD